VSEGAERQIQTIDGAVGDGRDHGLAR
jgi:hypothetical protein